MKLILRSLLAGPTDDLALAYENYSKLLESSIEFDHTAAVACWGFIKDFAYQHHHVPDISTVKSHFQQLNETDVVDYLEVVSTIAPITRGNFIKRVEEKVHDRRVLLTQIALKEAAQILQSGMEVKVGREKKILRGPVDAVRHMMEKSASIVSPAIGGRLYGEITGDGKNFEEMYRARKSDPLAGIGQHSGLQQMDQAMGGAKRGELWTHAAFTGQLKSTLMLTWAYNQAIWMGHSNVTFSLEMYYSQVRSLLFSMHTGHERFREIRLAMGIQKDPGLNVGLPYLRIRDAELTDIEEQFLFNHVVPDLDTNPAYGNIHIEVADPDKMDFTVTDLRARAETLYHKDPYSLIFVDHVGLLSPRGNHSGTTEKINEVVRDLKKMSMAFNRGQGMAMVVLAQINRQGYLAALKSNGQYNLTHLSYANEIERSSDVVTTTFLDDEMKKKGFAQFQCLKSRDQEPFELFFGKVDWSCRRILTCHEIPELEALTRAFNAANGMGGGRGAGGGGSYNKKAPNFNDVEL